MSVTTQRIESILTSPYSNQNYLELVNELFDSVQMVNPDRLNKEFSNFSSHIEGSTHIGNYSTPDGKKLIIVAVRLKAQTYVESSRSKQRSYAKKLIENAGCDAAFIAFYTEGDPKWRLSFVRLDYEMKIENGRLKAAESLTPAKRYSYLVGEGEPCHTAIDRLRIFIDNHSYHPTMDEIEDAFSVEKVTAEFFQLYCEKYHQIREHLESCEDFVIEAEQHNFTSAQFAKKLMGQIVFLYFLQKKGWLGVSAWPKKLNEKEYKNAFYARGAKSRELIPIVYRSIGDGMYGVSGAGLDSLDDADEAVLASCVKGEPWGTGPHNFMRRLYEVSEHRGANFYEDYLEPLFYDALNVNRGEQGYCAALHCRIPFLSGGLFEPIDGYEWKHNSFNLPNSLFSEQTNGNSRTGNGILDIFDRYNFTMSEDEPMEREVAIDPEMLGKVFENLLEVNDRKSKGAFYTPREIVHYMCQESLINYLARTMNLPDADIRDFILYGDFMKDEDTSKDKRQGSSEMYIAESLFKVEADGSVSVNRLYELDAALASVRVADPAVGSGAFPLGILNEIVRARQNITEYLLVEKKSQVKSSQQAFVSREMHTDRSAYRLKYETVKNCIFAADIEPSAVDIAQLRLWLSLVIDDEITPDAQTPLDGHRNPLPLPNLECNILCGNSLVDEFAGIRLINDSVLLGNEVYQIQANQGLYEATLGALMDAQDELFKCDNTEKKEELKERIAGLRDVIIMGQLENASKETLDAYEETKKMASKPYVLWQLDCARVFREKGGFDIVIGNPPYLDSENMVNNGLTEEREYISTHYQFTKGNWDIYIAFFEKGFRLLATGGNQIYITPDKWISKPFGNELRIAQLPYIHQILVAGRDVFKTALVDSIITMFCKYESAEILVYEMKPPKDTANFIRTVKKSTLVSPYALDIIFSDSIDIVEKMNGVGDVLGNHCTCENACATSDCYILKDILYSLESDADFVPSKQYRVINTGTIGRYRDRWGISPMRYLKDKYQFPVVDKTAFHSTFPNSYGTKPPKRKMIIKGLTLLDAALDLVGDTVPGKSTMMIAIDDIINLKIVAAFINSKVSIFYIKQRYSSSSYNGGINFTKDMINMLPWPCLCEEQRQELLQCVDAILEQESNEQGASENERRIDAIFFKAFDLSESEISRILS